MLLSQLRLSLSQLKKSLDILSENHYTSLMFSFFDFSTEKGRDMKYKQIQSKEVLNRGDIILSEGFMYISIVGVNTDICIRGAYVRQSEIAFYNKEFSSEIENKNFEALGGKKECFRKVSK